MYSSQTSKVFKLKEICIHQGEMRLGEDLGEGETLAIPVATEKLAISAMAEAELIRMKKEEADMTLTFFSFLRGDMTPGIRLSAKTRVLILQGGRKVLMTGASTSLEILSIICKSFLESESYRLVHIQPKW